MTNGDKPVYITRGEFYSAITIIWVYILLVIADLVRSGWRWTMGLLLVASMFMVVNYTFRSIRARKKSGKSI